MGDRVSSLPDQVTSSDHLSSCYTLSLDFSTPLLLIPVIIGGQDSVAFQYSVGSTEAEHEGASVDISRTNSGGGSGDIDDGRLKRFVSPMVSSVLSGQVIFIENILLSLDPKTASFTAEIRSSCPLSSSPCVHPMIDSFLKCS